jgi:hypothetical protein
MARIAPVGGAEAPADDRAEALALVSAQAASIFGHRPEMMEAFGKLESSILRVPQPVPDLHGDALCRRRA